MKLLNLRFFIFRTGFDFDKPISFAFRRKILWLCLSNQEYHTESEQGLFIVRYWKWCNFTWDTFWA